MHDSGAIIYSGGKKRNKRAEDLTQTIWQRSGTPVTSINQGGKCPTSAGLLYGDGGAGVRALVGYRVVAGLAQAVVEPAWVG